jgi:hypothetical protein
VVSGGAIVVSGGEVMVSGECEWWCVVVSEWWCGVGKVTAN